MDILNPVGPRNPNQQGGEGSNEDNKPQDNYIEGAEFVPLPSKGVFYQYQYENLDSLQVRQLNYTDEDILTTKSYLEDGSVFYELLKNVIVDKNGFDANMLSPIDRDTILLWLRSTSFGNDFEAETVCPECGGKCTAHWDISKFSIPQFTPEIYEHLKANSGEYEFETPGRDLKVRITVPSIGKVRQFEKLIDAKKKNLKTKSDLFGTGSLMLIVSAVQKEDGTWIRRQSEIESYFNKISLPLGDARHIRKQIEKINLSYDTKINIVCKHCDHIQEGVPMPMLHPNFFWPDAGV